MRHFYNKTVGHGIAAVLCAFAVAVEPETTIASAVLIAARRNHIAY